jgi:TolA-binding protein
VEALERQVRQLTREVADLTRQVEHEQKMRGFLEDRVQRLESSVHVGAALLLSLMVAGRPHAP